VSVDEVTEPHAACWHVPTAIQDTHKMFMCLCVCNPVRMSLCLCVCMCACVFATLCVHLWTSSQDMKHHKHIPGPVGLRTNTE